MEFDFFCQQHPKLKPDFFCLGKNCPYLMLCHECTLHDLDHAKFHVNSMKSCENLWSILKKAFFSKDNLKDNAVIQQIHNAKKDLENILEESMRLFEEKIEETFRIMKKNLQIKLKNYLTNIMVEEKPLFQKPQDFLSYLKENSRNINDQKAIIQSIFEKYENKEIVESDYKQIFEYICKKSEILRENTKEFMKSESLQDSLIRQWQDFEKIFNFNEWNTDFYANNSQKRLSISVERDVEDFNNSNDTIPTFSKRFHKPNSLDNNSLDVFGKITLIQTIDCGHSKQEKINEGVIISQVSVVEIDNKLKVLTCSKDKTIRVFDFHTFKLEKILEGHLDWVYRFLYFEINNTVVSGSIDKTIRLWDLKNNAKEQRCVKMLTNEGSIISLTKINSESFCFSMRISGMKISDLNLNILSQYKFPHDKEIWKIFPILKGNDTLFILGVVDGSIGVLLYEKNQKNLNLVNLIKGCHSSIIFDILCYQPKTTEKTYIITSSGDGLIKIWEINFGLVEMKLKCIMVLKGHEGFIRKMVVFKDDLLVSCSDDASIKFWNLSNGKLVHTIKKAHSLAIYWLEKFKDEILLTAGEDINSIVKFWQ